MHAITPRAHALAPLPAALLAATLAFAGCGREPASDAYGNFETTEVVVASELTGQLPRFDAREGARLAGGQLIGVVDTTQLALQRDELRAQRAAARARVQDAGAQVAIASAQRGTAQDELTRTRRLIAGKAATAQQLDLAEAELRVRDERVRSADAQRATVERDADVIDARLAQLEDRIRRSRIVNPLAGTVLATYVDAHEFVQVGTPLYKLADLDTMLLRAYVSGDQLPAVRVGQPVSVLIDAGAGARRTLPGVVSWIASEAEFTPTPIQTRAERADLVYAIKVRVPNPQGAIKIGMPGEVRFAGAAAGERVALTSARPPERAVP